MYHAVCREYIPNGTELNNEQVDEYAATWSPLRKSFLVNILCLRKSIFPAMLIGFLRPCGPTDRRSPCRLLSCISRRGMGEWKSHRH